MNCQFRRGPGWRAGATGPWGWVAVIVSLAVATGCATTLTTDTPPEVKAAKVKERSSARWAALIKGDKIAAYAYLSPGTRAMITAEQYAGRIQGAISYREVKIEKVECEAETCNVGLTLTYDFVAPKGKAAAAGVSTYVQETWVFEQGQAWFAWRP